MAQVSSRFRRFGQSEPSQNRPPNSGQASPICGGSNQLSDGFPISKSGTKPGVENPNTNGTNAGRG